MKFIKLLNESNNPKCRVVLKRRQYTIYINDRKIYKGQFNDFESVIVNDETQGIDKK